MLLPRRRRLERVTVNSSSIAAVGYDPARFVLEVEYVGGRIYRYLDVPPAVYRLLLKAPSAGYFVNTVVKPRFDCIRV